MNYSNLQKQINNLKAEIERYQDMIDDAENEIANLEKELAGVASYYKPELKASADWYGVAYDLELNKNDTTARQMYFYLEDSFEDDCPLHLQSKIKELIYEI